MGVFLGDFRGVGVDTQLGPQGPRVPVVFEALHRGRLCLTTLPDEIVRVGLLRCTLGDPYKRLAHAGSVGDANVDRRSPPAAVTRWARFMSIRWLSSAVFFLLPTVSVVAG